MKKLSIFGFLGVAIYVLTIIIAGLLRPDYTLFIDTISRIFAAGLPYSNLIAWFLSLGNILIIIFAVGVIYFEKNRLIKSSMSALILSGIVATTLFNFFPMDPWMGVRTAADIVHDNIFTIVVFLIWVAMVLMYFGSKSVNNLKNLSNYFLTSVVIFTVLIIIGWFSWENFYYLTGSIESLFLIMFLVWVLVATNWARKNL